MPSKSEFLKKAGNAIVTSVGVRSRSKRQTGKTVKLAKQIRQALSRAFPLLSQDAASSLAVDLADIQEIGAKHRAFLKRLLSLRFPAQLDEAENMLVQWIEVELLFHNQWHLDGLRRETPRLLKAISRRKHTVRPSGLTAPNVISSQARRWRTKIQ